MGRLHVARAIAVVGTLAVLAGLYQLVGLNWTLVSGGALLLFISASLVAVDR